MEIEGLPAHPLLVHAIVIGLPLTALAVVLAAVWPTARRRLGVVTPLAALVVLVLVPITVSAGRALMRQLGPNPAIAAHAQLGSTLLPWAIGLLVVAVAVWALGLVRDRAAAVTVHPGGGPGTARAATTGGTGAPSTGGATGGAGGPGGRTRTLAVLTVVVGVVAVLVAAGATWEVVQIGESGARAVWGR